MANKIYLTIIITIVLTIVSCSKPESSKTQTNSNLNAIENPTVEYSQELHGITIHNNYQWLKDSQSQQVIDWQAHQAELANSYFAPLLADLAAGGSQAKRYELANTSEYKLSQQIDYLVFSIKSKPYIDNGWQIDSFDTLELNHTNYPLALSKSIRTINDMAVASGARFIAFQQQLLDNRYQWNIYDRLNKKLLNHGLPVTHNKTTLVWLDKHRYLFSSDTELYYSNIRQNFSSATLLFSFKPLIEQEDNWTFSAQLNQTLDTLVIKAHNPILQQNKYWLKNLQTKDSKFEPLISKVKANFKYLANIDNTYYFLTNLAAGRNRIISIDRQNPARHNWKEVIAQSNAFLKDATLYNNKWLLHYLENTKNQLITSKLNGTGTKNIVTPAVANISITRQLTKSEPILNIEMPWLASQAYRINNSSLEIITRNQKKDWQNNTQNSKTSFYRSLDGSKIPITLIAKNEQYQQQPTATLLLSNQGFAKHYQANYNPLIKKFIEQGGLIAIAHSRGGNEYGARWHKAASNNKKFKAVEDILAASNWLLEQQFTSPKKQAIYASQHNSPLIAQVINRQPDNFSSALFEQGYFDLIDNPFIKQNYWQQEFGYTNDKDGIQRLLSFQPLQNIQKNNYPATLVLSTSSEVSSSQYLAKLQNNQLSNAPILLLNMPNNVGVKQQLESMQKSIFFLFTQLELE